MTPRNADDTPTTQPRAPKPLRASKPEGPPDSVPRVPPQYPGIPVQRQTPLGLPALARPRMPSKHDVEHLAPVPAPRRPSRHDSDPPLPAPPPPVHSQHPDHDRSMGQLMAAVAAMQSTVTTIKASVSDLASGVEKIRDDVNVDRGDLVKSSSTKAAARSSNRMAAAVSGLFVAWEVIGPFARQLISEIYKMTHQ